MFANLSKIGLKADTIATRLIWFQNLGEGIDNYSNKTKNINVSIKIFTKSVHKKSMPLMFHLLS